MKLHRFAGKTVRIIITSGANLDTLDGFLMYDEQVDACYIKYENYGYRIWINPAYVVTIRETI